MAKTGRWLAAVPDLPAPVVPATKQIPGEATCHECGTDLSGWMAQEIEPGEFWCPPHGSYELERQATTCDRCDGEVANDSVRTGVGQWRCLACDDELRRRGRR